MLVSIPFKRESVSKGIITAVSMTLLKAFQFPSNGKAYPKFFLLKGRIRKHYRVSIPFKRESVSKDV